MLPPLSGLVLSPAVLLDERSRPAFRDVFSHIAQALSDIAVAVAVTKMSLSPLDLDGGDLAEVQSLRVLGAELNALTLDPEARLIRADARRAQWAKLFRGLPEERQLEVRSALLGLAIGFHGVLQREGTTKRRDRLSLGRAAISSSWPGPIAGARPVGCPEARRSLEAGAWQGPRGLEHSLQGRARLTACRSLT
ncbi:MAG: hypothetical protein OSA81_05540 [Longimicrobiales bacterium]|nr:hypothetical protein [Longimicrobiales bacterium]